MAYDNSNIFASILRGEAPCVKVAETQDALAFMDIMPQSRGHTLVISKAPAENMFDLPESDLGPIYALARKIARAQKVALGCEGVAVFQLNGPAAGQTVFHYHVHVMPRYESVPWKPHSSEMADLDELKDHAEAIRKALSELD